MDKILPSYKMDMEKKVRIALDNKYQGRDATYYLQNWFEEYDKLVNRNLCELTG